MTDVDEFTNIDIDFEALSSASSEDDFMVQAVLLGRELMSNWYLLNRMHESDSPYSRGEAIIRGLFARAFSLSRSFMTLTCQKDGDGARIIFRSVAESLINMMYLIQINTEELFLHFVHYSLYSERNELKYIDAQYERNGFYSNIEQRIRNSILKSFKESDCEPDTLISRKSNKWATLSLSDKCKTIDSDRLNLFLFGQLHHIVHGNWENLHRNYLKYVSNSNFSIELDKERPRPQVILALYVIICAASIRFINYSFKLEDVKKGCSDVVNSTMDKALKIERMHEQWLNSIQMRL